MQAPGAGQQQAGGGQEATAESAAQSLLQTPDQLVELLVALDSALAERGRDLASLVAEVTSGGGDEMADGYGAEGYEEEEVAMEPTGQLSAEDAMAMAQEQHRGRVVMR